MFSSSDEVLLESIFSYFFFLSIFSSLITVLGVGNFYFVFSFPSIILSSPSIIFSFVSTQLCCPFFSSFLPCYATLDRFGKIFMHPTYPAYFYKVRIDFVVQRLSCWVASFCCGFWDYTCHSLSRLKIVSRRDIEYNSFYECKPIWQALHMDHKISQVKDTVPGINGNEGISLRNNSWKWANTLQCNVFQRMIDYSIVKYQRGRQMALPMTATGHHHYLHNCSCRAF